MLEAYFLVNVCKEGQNITLVEHPRVLHSICRFAATVIGCKSQTHKFIEPAHEKSMPKSQACFHAGKGD